MSSDKPKKPTPRDDSNDLHREEGDSSPQAPSKQVPSDSQHDDSFLHDQALSPQSNSIPGNDATEGEEDMQIQAVPVNPGSGLENALNAAPQDVRNALEVTHKVLRDLGIPHVLIGGLAVGVHGYPHATPDVDYLVEEKDAFDTGIVMTFKNGVPFRSGKVGIDYLVVEGPENVKRKMRECLEQAALNPEEVVVSTSDLLTYMKLDAGRAKDKAAVVEMLKAGMDVKPVRAFLEEAGNAKVIALFEQCVADASAEE